MAVNLKALLRSGGSRRSAAGTEDREHWTYHTTPWSWRNVDGVYVGHNKEVWLYRQLPLAPITWEDPGTKLGLGGPLNGVLAEIGATSQDLGGSGIASLARNRDVHLISVTWDDLPVIPSDTPGELQSFLNDTLSFLSPRRVLLLGVKLRPGIATTASKSAWSALRSVATQALGEDVPDLDVYEKDRTMIHDIVTRYGGTVPERDALNQLESWYNNGHGTDASIHESRDMLYIDNEAAAIELAAVTEFEQTVMNAPYDQWILDAVTHHDGPSVVSVRAELIPATVMRSQMRRGQRRMISQLDEEAATGDLERVEQSGVLNLAKAIEDQVATSRESWLSNASIIMARWTRTSIETYIDELKANRGISVKPLEHRQLAALNETLPCSDVRVNPFTQVMSISALAYSGIQGYSALGDHKGAFVGLADPDFTPCFLDFLGAPASNDVPVMGVFGDPGSGKTFLCQLLAIQAVMAGLPCVFINPKGMQSLSPFADLVGGTTVVVSQLEADGGFFDPFLYAEDPEKAAEILTSHILTVLGNSGVAGQGFTQEQELSLASGIRRGAIAGEKCAYDALQYVADPAVIALVMQQVEASPTFALGFGMKPRERYNGLSGLTLIEFDRELDLPEKGQSVQSYSRSQRISIAALRLVTRAALEILVLAQGGVMIVDEAWSFLSSEEGRAAVQSLGRKGRSWNILPIFATQRIADLLQSGVDMKGFMSRVFVMKLDDETEAAAALELCGLEATPQRIAWLKTIAPHRQQSTGQVVPARALHRDLNNRHAAVTIAPVLPAVAEAFSTNPQEVAARQARMAAEQVSDDEDEPYEQ